MDESNICVQTIICSHLDACNSMTILSESIVTTGLQLQSKKPITINIPETIDHWNIIEGLITIYYNSGYIMEIQRIHD